MNSKDLEVQKNFVELQKQEIEHMNILALEVKRNVDIDREKADDLYSFMEDQIDVEGDRNPSTRDAMAKALEIKTKGTDQLIELLKIKSKLLTPNKGAQVNINLGKYDEAKGGDTNDMISIVEKLENELGEDE